VPVEAGLDDATPSPDEVPATSRSLGEDEPPTEATLPMLGRPPRLLPGVRRAEPAVAPPGPDADATLVPRQLPLTSGHPLLDAIQLRSTSSESTVFAANPFVRPAAPAEVAAADLGRFPHIPLFEELSREAFLALVQESPLRSLPAGEVILEQDAEGDRFYVICAGRVRVYREEPSGRRELAILEAGAFFGELAVLTGARRSAWVVAEVDDTRLLEVSASTLERLARRHPSVAEGLLSFARRRILSNVMSAEALFSGFKRSERQTWAERFGPRELQAGEVLLAPGAAPPGLVVVVSGQLQVSGGGRPGFALGPGALLGDVELLAGVVEAQVKAATRSSVLVLPVRDAEALLEHPSNVARRPELLEAGRRRSAG
jgi:CRP-like cAMP-binding protein